MLVYTLESVNFCNPILNRKNKTETATSALYYYIRNSGFAVTNMRLVANICESVAMFGIFSVLLQYLIHKRWQKQPL